jgi:hypothetical protein
MPRIPRDALPTRREPSGDDLLDVTNPATGKLIAQVRAAYEKTAVCSASSPVVYFRCRWLLG